VWKSKDPSLLPLVDAIFSLFSFLPFPSLLSVKQSNRICLSGKKETPFNDCSLKNNIFFEK
jgi:hypothetical protein